MIKNERKNAPLGSSWCALAECNLGRGPRGYSTCGIKARLRKIPNLKARKREAERLKHLFPKELEEVCYRELFGR